MNPSDQSFLNAAEAASVLRSFAESLRRSKADNEAQRFERLANSLEDATSDELRAARLEKYKSELAAWEARVKYDYDWRIESFKGTLALAQRAITCAMIVNGGAAIALLAYMGNTKSTAAAFVGPLAWFSFGVLTAAATFALSYFSQLFYTGDTPEQTKIGVRFHYVTVISGVLSFILFAGGSMATRSSFMATVSKPGTVNAQQQERRNAPPPKAPGPAPTYPAQPAQKPPAAPAKTVKP